MTSEEFNDFQRRLFTMFPGTHAWLQSNSPDIAETLRSWHRRLERFSAEDCYEVLRRWECSNSEPFKAYDRENVPAIIASVVAKIHSERAKRDAAAAWNAEAQRYRDARRGGDPSKPTAFDVIDSDKSMHRAFQKLQPIHKRMLLGEISQAEYDEIKESVLDAMVEGSACAV